MRYPVLTLSAALFLGSVSFASAQTLRDDLDRMQGETPASGAAQYDYNAAQQSGAQHVAPTAPQYAPQAQVNVPQLAQLNQPAPEFNLVLGNSAQAGMGVALNGVLAQGPAVILFAPGNLAYTQPLFDLLQKNVANFQKVGVQPIGVSTDPVNVLQQTAYGYMMLSDTAGITMRHYGAIKQNNFVIPVLVSINAQGVIVDMQETLTPDLNRAARALHATQEVTAVESTVTAVAPQGQQLVQIQQVSTPQAVVPHAVAVHNNARQELASISDSATMPQFPPVEQYVPQMPPAVNVMPQSTQAVPPSIAPAMPPLTNNATVPNVPPAYVETQIQSY